MREEEPLGGIRNTTETLKNAKKQTLSVDTRPTAESRVETGNNKLLARLPVVTLPKGGGAIRGIGEKFSVNPVTGSAALTVPLTLSAGRLGFTPELELTYDSAAGNGVFGFGWKLSLPAITRKTDKGLPQYRDDDESDVFILAGAADLVPILDAQGARVRRTRTLYGTVYQVCA